MDDTNFPSIQPREENGSPPGGSRFEKIAGFWRRFPRRPPKPPRGAIVLLALLAALYFGARFFNASLQGVEPGFAGVCVSRFTGGVRVLAPGTHFRPRAFFEIHPIRISDQILAPSQGAFNVSTKEGVLVSLTVQARWAIDRERLLSHWAALPRDPGRELVAPILASTFRSASPGYEVAKLVAEKREELANVAERRARAKLEESGIVLKEVLVGDLTLPADYERGRVAMVDEVQNTERLAVTLKLKEKEVERTRLEAEAQKVRLEKEAEAAASQRLIAARGESEAMKYVLALKQKEIEQRSLEAKADKETRVQRAEAEKAVSKIQTEAEAERRRALADSEAYAIRTTSAAQFENLKREAELIQQNPLLIPKTFADRLSDKVQVILTPTIGGESFTGEVLKRVANGLPPVSPRGAAKAARSGAAPGRDADETSGGSR